MHQIPKMDIEYVMVRENPPPFDEKRWIGKGKIFPSNSSAFPDLKGYRKRKLFIPEDFYRYTFPNSEVTVKDFLALRLPKESYALVHPSASTCFSTFPANDDVKHLIPRALPSRSFVEAMSKELDKLSSMVLYLLRIHLTRTLVYLSGVCNIGKRCTRWLTLSHDGEHAKFGWTRRCTQQQHYRQCR